MQYGGEVYSKGGIKRSWLFMSAVVDFHKGDLWVIALHVYDSGLSNPGFFDF